MPFNLKNTYMKNLPENFYSRIKLRKAKAPEIVIFNEGLAKELGFNDDEIAAFKGDEGAEIFSGSRYVEGMHPIAQAYAGHQFGHFTMLGDGRALLLGEQVTPEGKMYDIQLKGSGRTSYSRRGDGKAVLEPMLREYIISEAMYRLGIPTTRSLAVARTGEVVRRESEKEGAVLTRIAESHIRVGTFEYAATFGNYGDLKRLADYTIERHFPYILDCNMDKGDDHKAKKDEEFDRSRYRSLRNTFNLSGIREAINIQTNQEIETTADIDSESNMKYIMLVREVVRLQASLVAEWSLKGFVHGVMNTDNMSIAGETIDYGPCAFMDIYHPDTVFSSIDINGRYSYGNQPYMALWNLTRLAESILQLFDYTYNDRGKSIDRKEAETLIQHELIEFNRLYTDKWIKGMAGKLGIFHTVKEDGQLFKDLLEIMKRHKADYTNVFSKLTREMGSFYRLATDNEQFIDKGQVSGQKVCIAEVDNINEDVNVPFFQSDDFRKWNKKWIERIALENKGIERVQELMEKNNPAVIPRNHIMEDVLSEAALGNYRPLYEFLDILKNPYDYKRKLEGKYTFPKITRRPYVTYCGT